MSHFTVAVVTKEEPNQFNQALEEALQPYHEYECTGTLDQYVVWVDETEEHRKEFETGTRRMLVNEAGEFKCPYLDEFYREPTEEEKIKIGSIGGAGCCGDISYTSKNWEDGKGYRAKVSFIPDGYTEKEAGYSEIYENIEAYVRDWCGYKDDNFRNGQIGRMTNPNKKWDWWQIGGRYSGAFKAKVSEEATQGDKSWTNENEAISDFDVIQKKNIDVEKMLADSLVKVDKEWAIFEEATKNGMPKSWGQSLQDKKTELGLSAEHDFLPRDEMDKLRKEHHEQEHASVMKELSEKLDMHWGCPIEHFCSGNKEEFIAKMKYYEFGTFAVLMDGNWMEKGKMGWWACVSDEDGTWESKWFEIFDSIDDEHWITVVDCHI